MGWPYTFLSKENETSIIQMKTGRRIFRSSCVESIVSVVNGYAGDGTRRRNRKGGQRSKKYDQNKKKYVFV